MKYLIIISVCLLCFGCGQAERNAANIKEVKVNMTVAQVKEIMGEPDSVLMWNVEPDLFRFSYEAPLLASDYIYVMFSKRDSLVVSKNDGM